MVGKTMWYAFILLGYDEHPHGPGGHVRQVTVVHDGNPDGSVVVRHESGSIAVVGGPFCSGRLFDAEPEAWAFCARRLREEAAKIDAEAARCAAKAAVEVVA